MKALIVFALVLLVSSVVAAGGRLADRAVLELNSVVYTQRQVEVLALVRSVLYAENDRWPINSKNWVPSLEWFSQQMLVDQEALRTQGYNPSEDSLRDALTKIESARKTNLEVSREMHRMGIEESSSQALRRSVITTLRTDSFIRIRGRRNNSESDISPAAGSFDWLRDLEDHALRRIFEGAREFKRIEPIETST